MNQRSYTHKASESRNFAKSEGDARKLISIVVPMHNEALNVPHIHKALTRVFSQMPQYRFEILFVDDGSKDKTVDAVNEVAKQDPQVSLLEFSRNFGKEAATSAGYHHALGDAVLAIDADLQHPPELIPDFIRAWEDGHEVVIGVRNNNASDSKLKKIGSHLYYRLIRNISHTEIIPRATDFRLLDRAVVNEFNKLSEHNRMTRGLVDWLGFRRHAIYFSAPERLYGEAAYSFPKLVRLAIESIISHSLVPLRLAGYLGSFIVVCSSLLGLLMLTDKILSLGMNFSGPAILSCLLLFLVGIILACIGLLAYYIGHIYHEAQDRPLYILRNRAH